MIAVGSSVSPHPIGQTVMYGASSDILVQSQCCAHSTRLQQLVQALLIFGQAAPVVVVSTNLKVSLHRNDRIAFAIHLPSHIGPNLVSRALDSSLSARAGAFDFRAGGSGRCP